MDGQTLDDYRSNQALIQTLTYERDQARAEVAGLMTEYDDLSSRALSALDDLTALPEVALCDLDAAIGDVAFSLRVGLGLVAQ